MSNKEKLRELTAQWQEAREVALVLHESWATLLRGKRLFLQSALVAGIASAQANKHYNELLQSAQKEYIDAFTRMCELADECTAARLGISPPPKKKRK